MKGPDTLVDNLAVEVSNKYQVLNDYDLEIEDIGNNDHDMVRQSIQKNNVHKERSEHSVHASANSLQCTTNPLSSKGQCQKDLFCFASQIQNELHHVHAAPSQGQCSVELFAQPGSPSTSLIHDSFILLVISSTPLAVSALQSSHLSIPVNNSSHLISPQSDSFQHDKFTLNIATLFSSLVSTTPSKATDGNSSPSCIPTTILSHNLASKKKKKPQHPKSMDSSDMNVSTTTPSTPIIPKNSECKSLTSRRTRNKISTLKH